MSLGLHGAVVASFLFAQSFDRTEVEGGRAQRSALITVTAAAPDASVPPPPAEPELVLDPTVDEPAADALDLDPERFDPIDWVLTEAPEKAPVDALLLEDPRLFEAAPHSPDREPRNRSFSADERAEPLPVTERAAEVADDAPAEETPPDAADRHGDVPVPDADAAVSSPPVAIDGACPPPAYPRRAVRLGWCGEVAVEITVDAGGAVVRARVLRSSGHGLLDDAALDAVRVWRFEPAEVGASAPRTMTKTFAFELP
ncbi:MAG: energy transducer TonB [Planctomycetota bacterium]